MQLHLLECSSEEPFVWRWPSRNEEAFTRSWHGRAVIGGNQFHFRHGIGERHAYGKQRVHSVTWINKYPTVEGVEADDYAFSRSLLSVIKGADRKHVRVQTDLPAGYSDMDVLNHAHGILAPYSPRSLAVKITEDDVASWVKHGAIRAKLWDRL
jgi:hypothetical protein